MNFARSSFRCTSAGSDLNGPWDSWEAWDEVWQGKWANLESLDSVLLSFAVRNKVNEWYEREVQPRDKPVDQSRDTALLRPDDTETRVSAFKDVVYAIDATISALEMRQVLGVSRDDRKADLQRARRIASWKRLMGAVRRSYPPQT